MLSSRVIIFPVLFNVIQTGKNFERTTMSKDVQKNKKKRNLDCSRTIYSDINNAIANLAEFGRLSEKSYLFSAVPFVECLDTYSDPDDADPFCEELRLQGDHDTVTRAARFRFWIGLSEKQLREPIPVEQLKVNSQIHKRKALRLATFLCFQCGPFPRHDVSQVMGYFRGALLRKDGQFVGFLMQPAAFNEVHGYLHDGMRMSVCSNMAERKPVIVLGFQLEPVCAFGGNDD